jgi:GNAT superfamily N-acetyltransferase
MNIARLTPAWASAYRALMLDAYERHPDAFTSTVAERGSLPASWWADRLAEGPGTRDVVVGAQDGARLAGAAGLSFELREKARHKATLFGMYVPAEYRGRGLGRRLVVAALDLARERPGILLVQLTVTQGNAAACALYASCGFVPFGVEPLAVAVGSGHVAKVHMWCDLRARADAANPGSGPA